MEFGSCRRSKFINGKPICFGYKYIYSSSGMSYKVVMLLDKKMPQKDFRIKLLEVMVLKLENQSKDLVQVIKYWTIYVLIQEIIILYHLQFADALSAKKIAESVVPNVANLCTLTFALKNFTKNLNNISW